MANAKCFIPDFIPRFHPEGKKDAQTIFSVLLPPDAPHGKTPGDEAGTRLPVRRDAPRTYGSGADWNPAD